MVIWAYFSVVLEYSLGLVDIFQQIVEGCNGASEDHLTGNVLITKRLREDIGARSLPGAKRVVVRVTICARKSQSVKFLMVRVCVCVCVLACVGVSELVQLYII